jgi:hypothetical protein
VGRRTDLHLSADSPTSKKTKMILERSRAAFLWRGVEMTCTSAHLHSQHFSQAVMAESDRFAAGTATSLRHCAIQPTESQPLG